MINEHVLKSMRRFFLRQYAWNCTLLRMFSNGSSVSSASAVQPAHAKRILSSFLGYLGGIQCDPRDEIQFRLLPLPRVSRDRRLISTSDSVSQRPSSRPASTSDSVSHSSSVSWICESRRVMRPTVKERRAVVITLTSCCMSNGFRTRRLKFDSADSISFETCERGHRDCRSVFIWRWEGIAFRLEFVW
jgi:hypothetical protein